MTRRLALLLCWPLLLGAASRSFDGANDNINFGNVLNVTTGNVSIGMWVKTTENATPDLLLGKAANSTNATAGYVLKQDTIDTSRFKAADGTNVSASVGSDIDGAWYYLVGTWDGTNNTTVLYENGAQVATNTTAVGSITTTANLQMGEFADGSNDAQALMAYGFVNRNIIATAVQINEMMWFPARATAYDASGWWPLWGDSPELDLAGGGVTGTVTGAGTSTDGPPVMLCEGLPL